MPLSHPKPQRVDLTVSVAPEILQRFDRLLKHLESTSDTARVQAQIDALTAQMKRQNDALEAFVASVPQS